MKTRKILALLLSGMLAVSGLAGCGGTESQEPQASDTKSDIKLSFIVSYKDEYLGSLDMAVKAAAESKNCTLSSTDCADDMDKQIEYVRAAASSGSDAAIVVLVDDNRAQEIVEAAGDMKVVFVNRIPQDDAVIDSDHVYIGSNEYTAGTEQGKMLANALKQAGKSDVSYLMFQGTAGLFHTVQRSERVLEVLKEEGITATAAAEPIDCGYDRNKAMDQMSVLLSEGLDMSGVDCIIANNDAMAMGVLESLRQNEVDTSGLMVVGIDGTNAGLMAIADGSMLATVYQNAAGQAAASVQAAINLVTGAELTTDINYDVDEENENIIWIPYETVTAENVGDYL